MGARPVAVMDSLRFGAADAPDTRRVLPGVVAGIGGYGNCLGLPNIGGEVVFDACYPGNPLVNALCVGVMRARRTSSSPRPAASATRSSCSAPAPAATASAASPCSPRETFDDDGPAKRPSVQVGDPFTEKLLIECCLEIFAGDLVVGIQDLGGAGLSCATSELASAGAGGMRVDLDRVPLRDASLTPEEILMSESQERMCAIVEPGEGRRVPRRLREVGRPRHRHRRGHRRRPAARRLARRAGRRRPAAARSPTTARSTSARMSARPTTTRCRPTDAAGSPARRRATSCAPRCWRWSASPNLADKAWVTEQYDRYVLGNTVLAQPEDAGDVRIDEESGLGVALATDGNGRYARLDPYAGAQLALAEAYRNVAATGARAAGRHRLPQLRLAGGPEVMWQFAEAVRGLADGCLELGIPVTGGNVSLLQPDRRDRRSTRRRSSACSASSTTSPAHADRLRRRGRRRPAARRDPRRARRLRVGAGRPRPPRRAAAARSTSAAERVLAEILVARIARRAWSPRAHDLSDGGLAQALVESALRGGRGARVVLPEGVDPFTALFSESAARAVVTVPRSEELRFTEMCAARGFACVRVGVVLAEESEGAALEVQGQFTLPLAELRAAWSATLPAVLDAVG